MQGQFPGKQHQRRKGNVGNDPKSVSFASGGQEKIYHGKSHG